MIWPIRFSLLTSPSIYFSFPYEHIYTPLSIYQSSFSLYTKIICQRAFSIKPNTKNLKDTHLKFCKGG